MRRRIVGIVFAFWTIGLLSQTFSEVSRYFYDPSQSEKGVPYVASTLEPDSIPADPEAFIEPLVIRLDAVDCTTLVEYVSATLLADLPSPDPTDPRFIEMLQRLRYRGGARGNYATRKHYFSEWISDAEAQGLLAEVTPELTGACPLSRPIDFMSQHVKYYPQLKACRILLKTILQVERELSSHSISYIPSSQIDKVYPQLRHGDIVAIVTDTPGLDVQHVGFVWYPDPDRHVPQLFHASSSLQAVTIDTTSLQDYARRVKHSIGIRVIRLKN